MSGQPIRVETTAPDGKRETYIFRAPSLPEARRVHAARKAAVAAFAATELYKRRRALTEGRDPRVMSFEEDMEILGGISEADIQKEAAFDYVGCEEALALLDGLEIDEEVQAVEAEDLRAMLASMRSVRVRRLLREFADKVYGFTDEEAHGG